MLIVLTSLSGLQVHKWNHLFTSSR